MRAYSLTELFNLTRAQLFALHDATLADMQALPEGSPDRVTALQMLRDIRHVLARKPPAP